jgi:hypothetical protein
VSAPRAHMSDRKTAIATGPQRGIGAGLVEGVLKPGYSSEPARTTLCAGRAGAGGVANWTKVASILWYRFARGWRSHSGAKPPPSEAPDPAQLQRRTAGTW